MSQRICGEAVSFRPVVARAAAPLGPSPSVADLLRLRIGGQIHRLGWYRTIHPSRICQAEFAKPDLLLWNATQRARLDRGSAEAAWRGSGPRPNR